MAQNERNFLFQRAVLWPVIGVNRYGENVVGSPVEIAVRWNTNRAERLDPKGNTVTVDGTAIVAQDIAIGSHMWLGTMSEWYGEVGSGSGAGDDELTYVKTFKSTPDVKGRQTAREVGLMRFKNTNS